MEKLETHILHNGEELRINQKQWNFARFFALSGNASQSRLKAQYTDLDDAQRNSVEAYKLFQNPRVQKAYEHHKVMIGRKIDISENRILAEIAAIGFGNLRDAVKDGRFMDIEEMSEATQRAIKKIKVRRLVKKHGEEPEEILEIEMHPKQPALETIMKLKGMKQDNKNQPISVTVNIDGQSEKKLLNL